MKSSRNFDEGMAAIRFQNTVSWNRMTPLFMTATMAMMITMMKPMIITNAVVSWRQRRLAMENI